MLAALLIAACSAQIAAPPSFDAFTWTPGQFGQIFGPNGNGPTCSPVYAENFAIFTNAFSNGTYWASYQAGGATSYSVLGPFAFLDGANSSIYPGIASELEFPAIVAGSGGISVGVQNYLANTNFASIAWSGPTTFSMYLKTALAGSRITLSIYDYSYTYPDAGNVISTVSFAPTSSWAWYSTAAVPLRAGDNIQVYWGATDEPVNYPAWDGGAPLSDVYAGGLWVAPTTESAGYSTVGSYGAHTTPALTFLPTSCPSAFTLKKIPFPSGLASSGATLLAFGDSETSNPNGAGATSWYVQPAGVGGVTLTDWAYSGMGAQDMDYEAQQKVSGAPKVCVIWAGYNNIRGGQFFDGQATPSSYSEPYPEYFVLHAISQCQALGAAVVLATTVPNYGDVYWTSSSEGAMEDFNAWVTNLCNEGYASCLDFHALLADATNVYAMRTAVNSGDDVHPNSTGTADMGVPWGQLFLHAPGTTAYSPPVIYPQVVTITHGTNRQLLLTFGSGPFTWSHTNSSAGSISQAGLYTATTASQTDTVTVTDAQGATSSSAVTVN